MFTFGFNSQDSPQETDVNKGPNLELQWKHSKNITIGDVTNIINACKANRLSITGIEIEYLCSSDVVSFLKCQRSDLSVLSADDSHSDLVTAKYEGGLKIWECTYDLLQLIEQKEFDFKDKTVLDLGCGSGIVGILAFLLGGQCCFQDYNEEVINYVTVPNVKLNAQKHNKDFSNCSFYSGDWGSFVQIVDQKFDYIFTSETIYNTDNYKKLISVFKNLLKPQGKVYLAAKSYYFGVGGGIASFQEALDKDIFDYMSCWRSNDGVKREILEISLK